MRTRPTESQHVDDRELLSEKVKLTELKQLKGLSCREIKEFVYPRLILQRSGTGGHNFQSLRPSV